MRLISTLFACCCLIVIAAAQPATSPLILERTIPLEKVEGRIDHMAADVARQRLFLAALGNNTVEVLDLKGGKTIQSLSGFVEPQGIAYAADLDKVFIANGLDGTCRILGGQSFQNIGSVQCGDDADNVRYDKTPQRLYVGYGGGALAVLDAKTGVKVADIKLAGHPESFQLETSGTRIFVNVPQAAQIALVDRAKEQLMGTWSLKEATSNFPMALDEGNHRLFSGCRNPARVLVYDISSPGGQMITSVPIAHDTDDLFYDAANKCIYVSCGEGSIEVIQQLDGNYYKALTPVATAPGARTSLFVPELKVLCLAVPHRGKQPAEVRVFKTR